MQTYSFGDVKIFLTDRLNRLSLGFLVLRLDCNSVNYGHFCHRYALFRWLQKVIERQHLMRFQKLLRGVLSQ